MADKPASPQRPIRGIPDSRDHEEASQGSGETSKNVKIAQQIVNQIKTSEKEGNK
jgi:hypothetical protein